MDKFPIITLISDFGTRSHYVSSMKAIMYRIQPVLNIVDITHHITPYNIYEAAFVLKNSYSYFPSQTIHVVVVDPEVGGDRKPIVVTTPAYKFVGPDNGVFSYVYDDFAAEGFSVYHLTENHFFRSQVSPTFHGRDIFSPAAAWLARGTAPEEVGPKLDNYTRVNIPKPTLQGNVATAYVMHIDSFGNVITNMSKSFYLETTKQFQTNSVSIIIGENVINEISPSYFALHDKGLGAVFGSTENLEITIYKKAAYKELKLNLFSPIQIKFG